MQHLDEKKTLATTRKPENKFEVKNCQSRWAAKVKTYF